MCKFKSGIILKNKVVLAQVYNDSHSTLLNKLNIEDNHMNAMKTFVRAELIPPNNNKKADIDLWKFNVDQDIVPDWFSEDQKRYEAEFRNSVREFMNEHFVCIADLLWQPIKKSEDETYYLLADKLFDSKFGENNNYAESVIRQKLNESDLAVELEKLFGDRIVPIRTNLTSFDGLKDYGEVTGDILSIPTIDLYRECRECIINLDTWWWLATPDSTPSGCGSDCVRCVGDDGCVSYRGYSYGRGVRPFFILKS